MMHRCFLSVCFVLAATTAPLCIVFVTQPISLLWVCPWPPLPGVLLSCCLFFMGLRCYRCFSGLLFIAALIFSVFIVHVFFYVYVPLLWGTLWNDRLCRHPPCRRPLYISLFPPVVSLVSRCRGGGACSEPKLQERITAVMETAVETYSAFPEVHESVPPCCQHEVER